MKKLFGIVALITALCFITACSSAKTEKTDMQNTAATQDTLNNPTEAESQTTVLPSNTDKTTVSTVTAETTVDVNVVLPDNEVIFIGDGDDTPQNIDKLTDENREFFTIGGTKFALDYTETLYYPIGDEKLDVYKLVNDDVELEENARVMFFQDGSVYAILGYTVAKIDIDGITNEQLVEKVEYELRDLIDFSKYNYVNVINPSGYSITWLKIRPDGYKIGESASVWISRNGEMSAITIYSVRENLFDIKIDLSEAEKDALIRKKLSEIFNTDKLSFEDYKISGESLTIYEGKACLYVSVSVDIFLKKYDTSWSTHETLLIVLEE